MIPPDVIQSYHDGMIPIGVLILLAIIAAGEDEAGRIRKHFGDYQQATRGRKVAGREVK